MALQGNEVLYVQGVTAGGGLSPVAQQTTAQAIASVGAAGNIQQNNLLVTVKATGNSVANARTVGNVAQVIVINATASSEGVKLPTPATGRAVTIIAPTANGVTVYASAAGQSIGVGTTNTTGFVVAKNQATEFIAISLTKWRIAR